MYRLLTQHSTLLMLRNPRAKMRHYVQSQYKTLPMTKYHITNTNLIFIWSNLFYAYSVTYEGNTTIDQSSRTYICLICVCWNCFPFSVNKMTQPILTYTPAHLPHLQFTIHYHPKITCTKDISCKSCSHGLLI